MNQWHGKCEPEVVEWDSRGLLVFKFREDMNFPVEVAHLLLQCPIDGSKVHQGQSGPYIQAGDLAELIKTCKEMRGTPLYKEGPIEPES